MEKEIEVDGISLKSIPAGNKFLPDSTLKRKRRLKGDKILRSRTNFRGAYWSAAGGKISRKEREKEGANHFFFRDRQLEIGGISGIERSLYSRK